MSNDLYKAGNELAWLDHVAESDRPHAVTIAKSFVNLDGATWAREWLASRLSPAELVELPAEIAKAAMADCDTALDAFDAAQAAFEKANNIPAGRGINQFVETEKGRDAYRKFSKAKLHAQVLHRFVR